MKYPAIYKSVEGGEYLYQNKDSYYCYERQVWDSSEPHHDCHHSDTNITTEYLANTYGEVKSKEHAEFIVKLAEVNSIQAVNPWREGLLFCFYYNSDGNLILAFYPEKSAKSDGEKQITIPLPTGCEGVDEWPKVGDDVLICNEVSLGRLSDLAGLTCSVIGICNNDLGDKILTLECEGLGVYAIADGPWIKKPKTPEQELRDELSDLAFNQFNDDSYDLTHNSYYLAEQLISKYNITKKPQ